jgi:hypothetical protein
MKYSKFKQFITDCQNFVSLMQRNNINEIGQTILLENYIKSYLIDHKLQIRLTKKHIREFIA